MVAAPAPVRADPHRMGMRTRDPAAAGPDPVAAPFPAAGSPKPQRGRSRRDGDDFGLQRRRGRSFVHHHHRARRHGPVTIDNLTLHAAGEQRQAGADQSAFDESCGFYIQAIRSGGG